MQQRVRGMSAWCTVAARAAWAPWWGSGTMAALHLHLGRPEPAHPACGACPVGGHASNRLPSTDLEGKSTALSQYTTALHTACTPAVGSPATSSQRNLPLRRMHAEQNAAPASCPTFMQTHSHAPAASQCGTGWRRCVPPAWPAGPAPHPRQTGTRLAGAAGKGSRHVHGGSTLPDARGGTSLLKHGSITWAAAPPADQDPSPCRAI